MRQPANVPDNPCPWIKPPTTRSFRSSGASPVAADAAYKNAKENTPHTARMAHDQALAKVMQHLLKDDTQVYKQFVENESFKRFVGDMVFAMTSSPDAGAHPPA